MISHPSPNYNTRPDGVAVEVLVMHYTGMQTGDEALERLCNPDSNVSAHYMIRRNGELCSLVAEEHRAWHAGVGAWRHYTNLNDVSIGIELENPGHEWGYLPFADAQIQALITLCQGIMQRHPRITPRNVIAHSDLAPARKQDPGELFPWHLLAAHGIGLWPDNTPPPQGTAPITPFPALHHFGYTAEASEQEIITAFQRHYSPSSLGKKWGTSCTQILHALMHLSHMH